MIYYRDSKRRLVIDMLRAAPEARNKIIAAWVGASEKYVCEIRSECGFPLLRPRRRNESAAAICDAGPNRQ